MPTSRKLRKDGKVVYIPKSEREASESGKAMSARKGESIGAVGTGNREVREYNNTKINQGQQDVIKRLNKKMPVGSNTPPMFGGGVLMEPIKYTLQADGTIEYKAKTMKLNSGVESATIGVGSISPNVRIYETTGRIMRDANVNNMRYSLMRLKGEKLVDKALSKKEYKEYEEMLQKSKTR